MALMGYLWRVSCALATLHLHAPMVTWFDEIESKAPWIYFRCILIIWQFLNPHAAHPPVNSTGMDISSLLTPAATPQPWLEPSICTNPIAKIVPIGPLSRSRI